MKGCEIEGGIFLLVLHVQCHVLLDGGDAVAAALPVVAAAAVAAAVGHEREALLARVRGVGGVGGDHDNFAWKRSKWG